MGSKLKTAILAAGGTIAVAGFLVLTAPDRVSAKPKSETSTRRIDITKPGESRSYSVFRNGTFHTIRVKLKRTQVVDARGTTLREEIEEESSAAVEALAQLPPVDPAFDNIRPSEEQIAEAMISMGRKPDGSGAIGDPPVPPGSVYPQPPPPPMTESTPPLP